MPKHSHSDSYSEAIPIDDLVSLAKIDVAACGDQSDATIRKCATKLVRDKLCPCASSAESIVNAVVDEYMRQLNRGVSYLMKTIPDNFESYSRTPDFSEESVPKGLLRGHQTKEGAWAKIEVLQGQLLYRILEPEVEEVMLSPGTPGFIEPAVLHEVVPQGQVSFFVEFYHEKAP